MGIRTRSTGLMSQTSRHLLFPALNGARPSFSIRQDPQRIAWRSRSFSMPRQQASSSLIGVTASAIEQLNLQVSHSLHSPEQKATNTTSSYLTMLPLKRAPCSKSLVDKLKIRQRGIVDPRHFFNEARTLSQSFGESPWNENGIEDNSELFIIPRQSNSGVASTIADQGNRRPREFFADQFEMTSNFPVHHRGTGKEI